MAYIALALLQALDLVRIDVEAKDWIASPGKGLRQGQSYVAQADYTDPCGALFDFFPKPAGQSIRRQFDRCHGVLPNRRRTRRFGSACRDWWKYPAPMRISSPTPGRICRCSCLK